jgi:hypothetical protein
MNIDQINQVLKDTAKVLTSKGITSHVEKHSSHADMLKRNLLVGYSDDTLMLKYDDKYVIYSSQSKNDVARIRAIGYLAGRDKRQHSFYDGDLSPESIANWIERMLVDQSNLISKSKKQLSAKKEAEQKRVELEDLLEDLGAAEESQATASVLKLQEICKWFIENEQPFFTDSSSDRDY